MKHDTSKLIVALDFDNEATVMQLVSLLDPAYCRLKVGKQLFTCCGPSIVKKIQDAGFDVFLDLKFHDIPNTTAMAVKAAADLGVWMVNVHAGGGRRMLEAAKQAIDSGNYSSKLIGVTVLTSMDKEDLLSVGINQEPVQRVTQLAKLCKETGLDGVVCSAWEAPSVKGACGARFLAVTPGIRPITSAAGDQRRVMTPQQAVAGGSDFIVVGRPITQAQDPLQVCVDISLELDGAGVARGSR